jgi:hypothetical protein
VIRCFDVYFIIMYCICINYVMICVCIVALLRCICVRIVFAVNYGAFCVIVYLRYCDVFVCVLYLRVRCICVCIVFACAMYLCVYCILRVRCVDVNVYLRQYGDVFACNCCDVRCICVC